MPAAFNKFRYFIKNCMNGKHNFATDAIKIALAYNAVHTYNSVLSDIQEIDYTHCSNRTLSGYGWNVNEKYFYGADNLVLTATNGDVGPFYYVVLYDDTAAGKPLIGWWEIGADTTITNGTSWLIEFDGSNGMFNVI